mgnify:CR=1 FL=1
MKNKKLVNLIIITLIIALIITAVIIKNTQANSSENNIAMDDEIVNEIQNTNDEEIITEESNNITENVILESDKENTQEADIIEQEIIIPKEEPKQTNVNTQEKKVDNSKKTEQPKTTQTTTQETISKQEPQVQEQKIQEQPKQETKTELIKEPEKPKCSDSKHGVGVGNSNRWFNSYSEAISFYDNLINGYSNQIHNGKITQEEYNKLCPYGYETWSCPYCGKWTLNYYYR